MAGESGSQFLYNKRGSASFAGYSFWWRDEKARGKVTALASPRVLFALVMR
jgi:hypothetical protein